MFAAVSLAAFRLVLDFATRYLAVTGKGSQVLRSIVALPLNARARYESAQIARCVVSAVTGGQSLHATKP
jgi:hypothetical protein